MVHSRIKKFIQRNKELLLTKKQIRLLQDELLQLQSKLQEYKDRSFTRPTKEELDRLFKQRLLDTSEEAQKRRAELLVKANILDEQGRYVERFFSEETLKRQDEELRNIK